MSFDFESWITQNQHIYKAFEREALLIAKSGSDIQREQSLNFFAITQSSKKHQENGRSTITVSRTLRECLSATIPSTLDFLSSGR